MIGDFFWFMRKTIKSIDTNMINTKTDEYDILKAGNESAKLVINYDLHP